MFSGSPLILFQCELCVIGSGERERCLMLGSMFYMACVYIYIYKWFENWAEVVYGSRLVY